MAENQNMNRNRSRRFVFVMLSLLFIVGFVGVAQPAAADDTRTGGSSSICVLPVGPRVVCAPDIRDGIAIQYVQSAQSIRLPE